jgi:mono/diheme cytochrome c family protein
VKPVAAAVGAVVLGLVAHGAVHAQPPGRHVYQHHCAVCHGEAGDGNGPAAGRLTTKPADFTSGRYKFRSTPSGAVPTDEDLARSIARGVRGTGMVPQPLPPPALRAVVAHLKTFSPRFAEPGRAPVAVPPMPAADAAVVARGARLYRESGCPECHGPEGRGDGPSARKGMKDARELPITPTDLTRRPFKRGSDPGETWKTLALGLDGTPMPSYADALDGAEIWAVVLFLESLAPPARRAPEDRLLPGEEALGDAIEREHMRLLHGPRS